MPEAGAAVTIVAPKMTEELQRLAARGKIEVKVQEATVAEVREAFLVIASADDPTVDEQIGRAARAARMVEHQCTKSLEQLSFPNER